MITLTDVKKSYSAKVAIGPIDIELPKGGITTLVGPNGAGKSTMLTMIGRLLGMDQGVIEVAGMDVAATKSRDLAKVLSILRQENHFITRLTVRQLVGFGRFPYSQGRLTTRDERIISKYIDFLDLTELEDRYLDQLSGGQRQRAYVAMVLCQETEYVLLDEPLNNLDIAHSVRMMKHLRKAAVELGRTIIIVLHDINFAAAYSDYICCIKDGRIARFGTPDEIMQDDVLSDIFDTEITVLRSEGRGPVAVYF
ncbi:MAG TPA: ATP-binding cassette domain-containing protein [Actinomycetaceae bacterium]|nr:ATP-binding cassette domain-containing protein [Actinomycetaceae bacterium]